QSTIRRHLDQRRLRAAIFASTRGGGRAARRRIGQRPDNSIDARLCQQAQRLERQRAHGVRQLDQRQVGQSARGRFGARQRHKLVGDDGRGGNAQAFELDGVVDTPRRARASI